MFLHDSLRSSGWLIAFSLLGASILSSCGRIARPDFSTGSGGTPGDGDGDMGGKPGDGDGDGDGDTGGMPGDGDGDGDGDETAPSCADDTCQNGATCGPDGDDYTCECADGFSGPKCETNIDDCANSPCENGGACVDRVAGFVCVCPGAQTGPTCGRPRFELLPSGMVPSGLSGDGQVVIGSKDFLPLSYIDGEAVQLTLLSGHNRGGANGLSVDGSIIAGYSESTTGETVTRPVKWQGTSVTELPMLSGADNCGANSVTADGSTIVGSCTMAGTSTIVRWQETAITDLGTPSISDWCGEPIVSGDGSAIFGSCSVTSDQVPFMWTMRAGMVALTAPSHFCRMKGVTGDGGSAIGVCGTGSTTYGTYYNGGSDMAFVGSSWLLKDDPDWFPLRDISSDGKWIIGETQQGQSVVAVRWNAARQPQKVSDLLSVAGGSSGDRDLSEGYHISDDGMTIVGTGSDNSGPSATWIVRLY